MIIEFFKYQGTGNDFIIIDDRKEDFKISNHEFIRRLCDRRFGVGADGLILLRNHETFDFQMIYFNSDGLQSSMCGNGGRCIVTFAKTLGLISNSSTFMAIDGPHKANIKNSDIYLQMKNVNSIKLLDDGIFLDTGSPHYVKIVDNLELIDIYQEAKKIRNLSIFKHDGVNVNFVSYKNGKIELRTYERGVEAETLSCGTGVVAAAIVLDYTHKIKEKTVSVKTNGGLLDVNFEEFNGVYRNIWLKGPASLVYRGQFKC